MTDLRVRLDIGKKSEISEYGFLPTTRNGRLPVENGLRTDVFASDVCNYYYR